MSIIGSNILAGSSGQGGAYEIKQSLRFNDDDSAHLTRTPSSAGNRETWTFSCWVKVGSLSQGERGTIFQSSGGPTIYQDSGLRFAHAWDPAGTDYIRETVAVFRDPSAWYHVVWWCDTAQSGTRWKIYVNGVEQTLQTPSGNNGEPAQDADLGINSTNEHTIGEFASSSYLDGYLAEAHFIDGSALDADNFGEYDDNGVWRPIEYTGSYGTNGFYLKFDPNATNGIGHDHSGNGNNWTANNFTTSGTGTDVMSDTPTTNYATINPLFTNYSSASDGNLVLGPWSDNGWNRCVGTISQNSGKWYFEVTADNTLSSNTFYNAIGVAVDPAFINSANLWGSSGTATSYAGMLQSDEFYPFSNQTYGTAATGTYSSGTVMQCAIDIDAGKLWFGIANSWLGGGNPASGTTPTYTITANAQYYFGASTYGSGSKSVLNFGQRSFDQTPPTGFSALNTSNLPAPDIADGSDYFNTVLWTGNATARDITTGHNSNFTWIKHRNSAENHNLYDILRGTGNRLESNSTDKEVNYTDRLTAFNSDGFSLGTGYNNTNTTTYVGWSWAGGGSGSSNTDGSITSTVSANPTAGFSIVTYAGSGTGGDSIGHGLGVPPKMIIAKSRGGGPYPTASWAVYHESIGASKSLALDTTAAAAGPYSNPGTIWYNTTPTSTVFYVGNLNETNGSNNYVAYCFAEVEGYSKFGSYTGNGSFVDVNGGSDGPFVYCGFEPQWVMIKQSNTSNSWIITDNKRDTTNPTTGWLYADGPYSEDSNNGRFLDFLSNGFKIRSPGSGFNTSGGTYLFVAFASSPFGGSGVSPATAR